MLLAALARDGGQIFVGMDDRPFRIGQERVDGAAAALRWQKWLIGRCDGLARQHAGHFVPHDRAGGQDAQRERRDCDARLPAHQATFRERT